MNKIRFFDLFIFTILAILSEFLSSYFFNKVGSQFYLSFATLIFIIASIRWGAYSVFVIILSGIPLLFTQNQMMFIVEFYIIVLQISLRFYQFYYMEEKIEI